MRGEKQHDVSRVKPYIPTRRAQVKQEIDRTTWADTTMVVFPVNVEGAGEYLTEEPVMFGQAFESPPFFTFSNVTAPFLPPEVRAIGWPTFEPCRESPVTSGGQILTDGSFENFTSTMGRTQIPLRNYDAYFNAQLWWSDINEFPAWTPGVWVADDTRWSVAAGGADTGDYYAHWAHTSIGGFLYPAQFRLCSEFRGGPVPWYPVDVEPWLHAGRAKLGDTINVKFKARGSSGQEIHTVLELWRTDGAFQNEIDPVFLEDHPVTTSWAEYELELTLPGTATDPEWLFVWGVRALNSGTLDIDSVVISQS